MRAHFLGTADGHTSARREHSGILLQTRDASLLLDCGAAAARYLLGKELDPAIPEILWISHMHSDHNGQISSLIQSLWLRARRAPLHVFGPQQVLEAIRDWLEKCLLFPELIGFPIEWHPLKAGESFVHRGLTLTAFPTEHLANLAGFYRKSYPNTSFDCFGLVLDDEGKRYVYSSDLAHPRELLPALEGQKVDGLFCELAHFPERELFCFLAPYPVAALWLTHYPDHLVKREADLQTIAHEEKFRGDVHLMHDGIAPDV
jgi:ribonuclease BN (tRNA processing enzyme)